MSYGVKYSPLALKDMDAVWDEVFLASQSYDVADRYVLDFAAKIAEQRKEITGVPRNLEDKVIFGGRLGEYKYYDMDQVIAAALERAEGLG